MVCLANTQSDSPKLLNESLVKDGVYRILVESMPWLHLRGPQTSRRMKLQNDPIARVLKEPCPNSYRWPTHWNETIVDKLLWQLII